MQEIIVMECTKCGKTYEWPLKQFTRYLRNHPGCDLDNYLCKECATSKRMSGHGESGTVLYGRWKAMFARTRGQGHPNNVKYYLAKGIKVCPEWYDYKNFRKWALANGFDSKLVIDRIDGNKGYEPENCRWVTYIESNNNKADHEAFVENCREAAYRRHGAANQISE
jgi:hypothetical protein